MVSLKRKRPIIISSFKKNFIIDNDIIFIPNSSVQVGYVSYSTPLIKYNKQYASFLNEKC